jgi:ABC-type multidrug transport system ATPase subunit
MGEAEELCDRIGILLNGELIAIDTADALKRRYQVGDTLPTLEEVFMAATGTSLEDAEFAADDEEAEAKAA